jgi:antitoxin VapB
MNFRRFHFKRFQCSLFTMGEYDLSVSLTNRSLRQMLWHMPLTYERIVIDKRQVRLFRKGRNQVIRIPREMELVGEEALIYREGNRLIIEPIVKDGLVALLAGLETIDENFPDIDEDLPMLEDVDL